jgi:hypothetical protein
MFDVRCSVFDVRCSMFDVRCSVFDVRCSVFGVRCSVFDVRCSMFSSGSCPQCVRESERTLSKSGVALRFPPQSKKQALRGGADLRPSSCPAEELYCLRDINPVYWAKV